MKNKDYSKWLKLLIVVLADVETNVNCTAIYGYKFKRK